MGSNLCSSLWWSVLNLVPLLAVFLAVVPTVLTLAVIAGTGYLVAGMVDGSMLLSLLCGSVPAVLVGSLLAKRFSSRWLQVALALVLVAVAAKTLA